MLGLDLN
jgi:hypothetical protein